MRKNLLMALSGAFALVMCCLLGFPMMNNNRASSAIPTNALPHADEIASVIVDEDEDGNPTGGGFIQGGRGIRYPQGAYKPAFHFEAYDDEEPSNQQKEIDDDEDTGATQDPDENESK